MDGSSSLTRSGRVIVIGTHARILLLGERHPSGGTVWITPGGGADEDEDVATAACRELSEEVGLRIAPAELGEPLAIQTRAGPDPVRDTFYAVRTPPFEPDLSGLTPFERDVIVGHRWSRISELDSCPHRVLPGNLSELVALALERDTVTVDPART